MTRILLSTSLGDVSSGEVVEVTGEELHYLKNVRRHGAGDTVILVDNDANSFEAIVLRVDSAQATLSLGQPLTNGVVPLNVHILAAVPKEKLLDDVVRKLSELGVNRFTPLICERSSVVPGAQRQERWQRIATQSMRQCRRQRVLDIDSAVDFDTAVRTLRAAHRFMLHPDGGVTLGALMQSRGEGDTAILVGPEGGFSPREVALATEHSFKSMRAGHSILRMETAMLVASVAGIAMLGGYDV